MFAVVLLLLGCQPPASVPPPPPSVVLDKHIFRPERIWYITETIVDGAFAGLATVTGRTAPLEKIRWVVQENFLIGYRAYSLFWGTGNTGTLNTEKDPIVQFRILGHFDVFNGRLVSVPEKRWSDKPYMRVDWSSNLVGKEHTARANSFTVLDPDDPDAVLASDDYVEVTTRYAAATSNDETDGWSSNQSGRCNDGDFMYCEPNEFTAKWSMFPVPPDDGQYEVVEFPQAVAGRFQMFRKSFLYVDPLVGNTETGKRFFADTYKIWKRSRGDDGRRLPLRQREIQPIVWYLSPNYPRGLLASTQLAFSDWNQAFSAAVSGRRFWECREAGEPETTCAPIKNQLLSIVKLCPNNPVQAGDDPDCGAPGLFVRIGDVRYNSVQWIDQAALYPTAGIGWFNVDHENARIVSSTIFFNGYGLMRYAGEFAAACQLMNGDLSLNNDYFLGNDVIARVRTMFTSSVFGPYTPTSSRFALETTTQAGPWPGLPFPHVAPSTQRDLLDRVNALDLSWRSAAPMGPLDASSYSALQTSLAARLDTAARSGVLGPPPEQYLAAKNKLLGTELEDQLIDREALLAAGIDDPAKLGAEELRRRASPLRSPAGLPPLPNHVIAEPIRDGAFDAVYSRFAQEMKGQPFETIVATVLERGFRGFVAHELGHTFGVRHNFAGSYDPLNFGPEYWRIRNDGQVGPRWRDPMTQQELQQGLLDNSYSSVMDYFGALHERNQGLGLYDKAIIKYVYGGLVEVLNDPLARTNGTLANQIQMWHQSLIANGVFTHNGAVRGIHYTQYPSLFGDLHDREDVPAERLVDFYGIGTPLALPDGRPAVPYRTCTDMDTVFATCRPADRGADVYEIALDKEQRYYAYYTNLHFRRNRLWVGPPQPFREYFDFFQVLSTTLLLQEAAVSDPSQLVLDEGLAPVTLALGVGLEFLLNVITAPEPGEYSLAPRPVGPSMYLFQRWGDQGPHVVPPGEGWFFSTEVEPPSSGRGFRSRTLWWGMARDKTDALNALTEPMTAAINLDTLPNPAAAYATVVRAFKQPSSEFFRSALSLDWSGTGPYFDPSTRALTRRRWSTAGAPWPPSAGAPLDPRVPPSTRAHLRTRLLLAAVGLADNQEIDLLRITVNGSSDDFSTTLPVVSFTDDSSGRTFRAISRVVGGRETGYGAAMLARATALLQAAQNAGLPADLRATARSQLTAFVREIEHVRKLVQQHDRTP